MKEIDFLEDYVESIVENKIKIISSIEESEKYFTFRFCLFNDSTETVKVEINKENFSKWVKDRKSSKELLKYNK